MQPSRSWWPLRKTGNPLYLAHGGTYTHLTGKNAEARLDGSTVYVKFDLRGNLRVRNKNSNVFIDARDLADGAIDELTLVQVNDQQAIDRLVALAKTADDPGSLTWCLVLLLDDEHEFEVEPSSSGDQLTLKVRR